MTELRSKEDVRGELLRIANAAHEFLREFERAIGYAINHDVDLTVLIRSIENCEDPTIRTLVQYGGSEPVAGTLQAAARVRHAAERALARCP